MTITNVVVASDVDRCQEVGAQSNLCKRPGKRSEWLAMVLCVSVVASNEALQTMGRSQGLKSTDAPNDTV